MPFKSEAQRKFLWAKHPKIAERWAHEYKTPKDLPEHVEGSDKKSSDKSEDSHMSFPEQVIDAFQCAGAALTLAEKAAADKVASEQKYANLIPNVVDVCVKFGRIDNTDEEKQALSKMLATPEGALDVITKMAAQEPDTQNVELGGQQVDLKGNAVSNQKRASNSGQSPYVGRRTSEVPDSWQRMQDALGV